MKQVKKYFSLFMVLTLMLSVFGACGKKDVPASGETGLAGTQAEVPAETSAETQAAAEQEVSTGYYQIGDKIDDFTITTYDGREVSLYKVLEEKDMVLLNLWATWCGPCGSEFPAMQQAYEQYQDKVEIIALSTHEPDTDEILAEYAKGKGMTFCVTRDTVGLGSRINHSGIPTSIVVDRFGTICLIEEGAMPDPTIFANLFDVYTAGDYAESVYMPSMLSEKPSVQPSDPAALKEALNAEGGSVEFTNSSGVFDWPMTVVEKDGRTVVAATNMHSYCSKSVVNAQVDVKAGDVLVMEYKFENDAFTNLLYVEVDGKNVKKSSLSRDWGSYAYRFEEDGSHAISVGLEIELEIGGDNNGLWIDSIRVVSGDEAVKALEANPDYPVGDKNGIQLLNENAKAVRLYNEADPTTTEIVYFCPDPTLQMLVTLDATVDPENTHLENPGINDPFPLIPCAVEDGYLVTVPNATPENYVSGAVIYCNEIPVCSLSVFPSEEVANGWVDLVFEIYGLTYKWEYLDDSVSSAEVTGDVTYTVTYVDQNGNAVPGVMCQVCDESMCQVFTSDANGVCRFTLPAKNYEIHTLMVPAGYEGDTTTITQAPAQGGELTFTLTKK